jgi:hypothetical protein
MPLIAMTREMGSLGRERIAIAANRGTVTLSGTLEPGLEERDALDVASRVPGAKNVNSALKTLMPSRLKLGVWAQRPIEKGGGAPFFGCHARYT